ncbi:putative ribonuclease H-like domain-containing protein [Tanacetum coccineum]
MEDEFYNLVVKGNDLKTYARRFQELAILCPNMAPKTKKLMEVFIKGLPRSIEGNVTASKPQTLDEAITITQRLMDHNGVAERKNRTLIEASRTMLVDSKLPTTFWSEVVNTACYVLNRVLVIKPHNKTPYELIRGRPPLIDFMKPFGCPVTILNTRDHLGKFDEKADEGFFVGYSVVRNGPDWLFYVDSLTKSMNYVPVVAGNQTNGIVETKDNIVTGQAKKKIEPEQEYILIPICTTDPLISQDLKDNEEDVGKKPTEVDESGASNKSRNDEQEIRSEFERLLQQEKQSEHINSTNSFNTVSTPVSAAGPSFSAARPSSLICAAKTPVRTPNAYEEHLFEPFSPFKNAFVLLDVPNVSPMDDTGIFDGAYNDEDVGAEADLNNLETTMNVEAMQEELLQFKLQKVWTLVDLPNGKRAIGTKWVFKNKKDERGIVVRNKARLVAQGFIVYQMDVKSAFLYGTIEEEVYVCQPSGFEDPQFPNKVYKVEKALYGLHQDSKAYMRPCLPTYWKMDLEDALLIRLCSSRRTEVISY